MDTKLLEPALSASIAHLYGRPQFLLRRADQVATALYAALSPPNTRLRLLQTEMLFLLRQRHALDQVSLARLAGLDKATAGVVIANLASARLVKRTTDPEDGRRRVIVLHPGASDRGRDIWGRFQKLQTQLLAPIPESERDTFIAVLGRLASLETDKAPPWQPDYGTSSSADEPPSGDLTPLFTATSFLIRRALQVAQGIITAATAKGDLTPRQFAALSIMADHPALSQIELARLLGWDPSTAALVLDLLRRRRLASRTTSTSDRRRWCFDITPAGSALLLAAQPMVATADRETFTSLGPRNERALAHWLAAIVRAYDERMRVPLAMQP